MKILFVLLLSHLYCIVHDLFVEYVMETGSNGKLRIAVRPFRHQVGGHTCMFQIGTDIVCKPYEDRELVFYQTLPDAFKGCVPEYLGITEIKCTKNQDGITFYTDVPRHLIAGPRQDEEDKQKIKVEKVKSGLENWSHKCLNLHLTKYGYWKKADDTHSFIMLRNLVATYQLPCLIDLKMGTRQHIYDCSEEKRKLFNDRCASTTSGAIGFRLSGSQVYKADSNSYILTDKYDGRTYDVPAVHKELRSFFYDGIRLRSSIIKCTIEKLQNLHDVIHTQNSHLFYSCSLLMLYDSAFNDDSSKFINNSHICEEHKRVSNSVDVKLIDFGHTVDKKADISNGSRLDEGVLYGLEKLIEILQTFTENG